MRTSTTVTAVLLGLAVALAGCASEPQAPATVTATETTTATVVATVTATPDAAVIPGMPAEITGTWCPEVTDDECFDTAAILSEYPEAFVETTSTDPDVPGAVKIRLCLAPDGTGTSCDNANSLDYEYLPEGVTWDCEAVAANWGPSGFDDCDPDYSSVHDTTRPRLLFLFPTQPGAVFQDVPPLYQQPAG